MARPSQSESTWAAWPINESVNVSSPGYPTGNPHTIHSRALHHARNSNHPVPSTNGGQLDDFSRVSRRVAAGSRKRVMIASSQLTYMGLLLAVFANQACLPVPSMAFLMVA